METKHYYLQLLAEKLTALYNAQKAGQPIANQRAELNGYLQAAQVLQAISTPELQRVIDDVYLKAYGKHRRERDKNLTELDTKEVDWAYFDKPRWER